QPPGPHIHHPHPAWGGLPLLHDIDRLQMEAELAIRHCGLHPLRRISCHRLYVREQCVRRL
ncbi:hypothetical protein TNIN_59791, partial [Trichonephila inaurata madagascariensis]